MIIYAIHFLSVSLSVWHINHLIFIRDMGLIYDMKVPQLLFKVSNLSFFCEDSPDLWASLLSKEEGREVLIKKILFGYICYRRGGKIVYNFIIGRVTSMPPSLEWFLGGCYYLQAILSESRVYGVTVSAFAQRWGGDGFNTRPKLHNS